MENPMSTTHSSTSSSCPRPVGGFLFPLSSSSSRRKTSTTTNSSSSSSDGHGGRGGQEQEAISSAPAPRQRSAIPSSCIDACGGRSPTDPAGHVRAGGAIFLRVPRVDSSHGGPDPAPPAVTQLPVVQATEPTATGATLDRGEPRDNPDDPPANGVPASGHHRALHHDSTNSSPPPFVSTTRVKDSLILEWACAQAALAPCRCRAGGATIDPRLNDGEEEDDSENNDPCTCVAVWWFRPITAFPPSPHGDPYGRDQEDPFPGWCQPDPSSPRRTASHVPSDQNDPITRETPSSSSSSTAPAPFTTHDFSAAAKYDAARPRPQRHLRRIQIRHVAQIQDLVFDLLTVQGGPRAQQPWGALILDSLDRLLESKGPGDDDDITTPVGHWYSHLVALALDAAQTLQNMHDLALAPRVLLAGATEAVESATRPARSALSASASASSSRPMGKPSVVDVTEIMLTPALPAPPDGPETTSIAPESHQNGTTIPLDSGTRTAPTASSDYPAPSSSHQWQIWRRNTCKGRPQNHGTCVAHVRSIHPKTEVNGDPYPGLVWSLKTNMRE